jgi:hypothetical protein
VRRLQHESTDCSKRYLEDGHDRLLVADSGHSEATSVFAKAIGGALVASSILPFLRHVGAQRGALTVRRHRPSVRPFAG